MVVSLLAPVGHRCCSAPEVGGWIESSSLTVLFGAIGELGGRVDVMEVVCPRLVSELGMVQVNIDDVICTTESRTSPLRLVGTSLLQRLLRLPGWSMGRRPSGQYLGGNCGAIAFGRSTAGAGRWSGLWRGGFSRDFGLSVDGFDGAICGTRRERTGRSARPQGLPSRYLVVIVFLVTLSPWVVVSVLCRSYQSLVIGFRGAKIT